MGEIVRSISRISRGYNIYIVVLANTFGNRAETVINELFERVAYKIGVRNVISKVVDPEGLDEAVEKFKIKYGDRWPILLIMQRHPKEWKPKDKLVKIQLGNMKDDADIRDFLFQLAQLVLSDDFGRIRWQIKKERIIQIAKKIPYANIVVTALGVGAG